jgi:phenylalanyl-tRNA synthetase beta chain
LARAIEILREVSPGIRLVGGVADRKKEMPAPAPIRLPLDWMERKLGRPVDPSEVRRILESLEFGVAALDPRVFAVTVPSWRSTKDVSIKDDLVEDVGRMLGYDSIAPQAPLILSSSPPQNPERGFQHEARALFVDLGFTEVHNYSFLSEEAVQAFGFDAAAHLRVANPIASDQALMRTSLLPGIWSNIRENSKHRDSFRLFEIGVEIHRRAEGLPDEIPHLVAAVYDRQGDGPAGLFEIKRAAECFLPEAKAMPAEARPFEHPARAAEVLWRGRAVGRMFELHPSMLEAGRAAILDLDLRLVESLSESPMKYTPFRRYPSSAFDLSVIAGLREHAGKLEASLASFAGPLLEAIEFVRQYSGPPLEEGRQSVSFRLTVGSPERTLSSEEIGEIRAQIIAGMRTQGYDLRM